MNQQQMQDYTVHPVADAFCVHGQIDGQEITRSRKADEAIQSAIDALGDLGGQVRLGKGVYPLRAPLRLASHVWLCGSGRGTRLIVEPSHSSGVGLLCEGVKGVVISDLAVRTAEQGSGEAAIVIDDCGDCQVRDVLCQGFAGYGIWMRNNSFLCELQGCKLANNVKANIYADNLAGGGRGGDFVPNLITNCITYGGGTGIECNRAIVLNIVGCAVFQPLKYAYYLHHTSNSVLISGCRSFQVEEHAIVAESSHELNVSSNIFCWHRGNGIVMRDVSWGAITGNEFIDQGVRSRDGCYMAGIVLSEGTRGVQISGNTIFNWGDQRPMRVGIHEDESCRNNIIQGNNINYFVEADILSLGRGTVVSNNVGEKREAYLGAHKPSPDFTVERIERFFREQ